MLTKFIIKAKGYTTLLHTYSNGKVNSVQEACAKCFAVHILKIWNRHEKTKQKTSIGEKLN